MKPSVMHAAQRGFSAIALCLFAGAHARALGFDPNDYWIPPSQWQRVLDFPSSQILNGIWGCGPNDVFVVANGGTIAHFDGNSWSMMTTGDTNNLIGVWGSGPNDVFAVGAYRTILHYDGASWSPMSTGIWADLTGVWGTGPNNVYIVGSPGGFIHYDGSAWTTPANRPSGTMTAIWGTGPNEIFAVGYGGQVFHYDGASWSAMASGTWIDLTAVWGSGPNDVYAVGGYSYYSDPGIERGGILLHYDGAAWSVVLTLDDVPLTSVWGTHPGNVFVGGWYGTMLHYDGSAWESKVISWFHVHGIWGWDGDYVFATINGDTGELFQSGALIWSGDAYGYTPFSTGSDISAGGPNDIFVVGSPRSFPFPPPSSERMWRYDGAMWTAIATPSEVSLSGVWARTPNDVFAVGSAGLLQGAAVVHYDGQTATSQTVVGGTGIYLFGVWGSGPADVFAVGAKYPGTWEGAVFHYDGTSWSAMSSPSTLLLLNVWGSGPNDVFAVGADDSGGVVLHYDGASWSAMSAGASGFLSDIWGTGPNDVFVVGGASYEPGGERYAILHYNGQSWKQMDSGTTMALKGVCGRNHADVFAVGSNGVILHYDGISWSRMISGTTEDLTSVCSFGLSRVFAVGGSGTFLTYFWPWCTLQVSANNPALGEVLLAPYRLTYPIQATVRLTANPAEGCQLVGWIGDTPSRDNPLTLIMDMDKTLTAVFAPDHDVQIQWRLLGGEWRACGAGAGAALTTLLIGLCILGAHRRRS